MHISAYEACLERVAEELMGRRKWKHIQELHTKSHMNTEETNKLTTTNTAATKAENLSVGAAAAAAVTISAEDRQKSNEEKITHSDLNLLESSENKHMQKEQIYTITKKDEDKEDKEDKDIDKEKQHHKESSQDKKENETAAPVKDILEHKIENEIKSASGELAATETAPLEPAIENNNNKGEPESSDITKTETRKSSESERLKSVESPPPAEPIDWKPDDKCNFCINGKLLTVNDKGELVAESGPAMSETEAQRLDTDSDSDVSSSNQAGSVKATEGGDHRRLDLAKLLTSRQREFPANMASINSLSPQLATNFPVFQNLNWLQLAQQTAQQLNAATPTTSDISAAALSPSLKDSPSPSDATGEQPLDLSSKPSPNSSTCGDLKVVRPKSSRSTPLLSSSGRRTYSDEDLNNALQDVLSGKSGTRKAAVRYSVPRSTLRNKMQALQNPQQMEVDNSDEDGDENDAESSASVQQTNEATEQSFDETFQMALLKKLSENNGNANTYDNASASSTTKNANKLQNNTAPLLAEALAQGTQPAALLQALMLVSNFGGLDDRVSVRDLLSALLINTSGTGLKATSTTDATSDTNAENSNLNNGRTANLIAQRLLYQQLQQQENQQQQQRTSSPYATTQHRLATSDTPETNSSSLDAHDDEQSSILKIPSYKPVAGSNTREHSISPTPTLVNHNNNNNANSLNSNLHRNGDSPQSALSPRIPTSLLAANLNVNSTRQSNIPVISPPLPSHQSLGSADSQSPPSMCFRDMIANSIHRTMSDQASKDSQGDYKKPSISVVKNIGGTDTSRFGAAPNVLAVVGAAAAGGALHHSHQSQFHLHSHHSSHHLSRAEAAALAAGKGTRPKRGKYRNYDRDSLVEAVKAVQRGEMSVHRAGSYYGVPHSTLEYKVKERHLMRPRKREPKPQPGLDGSSTGGSASTSKSNSNIPGLQNSLDKMKVGGGGAAGASSNLKQLNNALKNNSNSALNYTSASQNGMKLPLFDPATMAQYAPQFFWQHGPTAAFNQLQMDLNRNAAAAAAQSSVAHMQRLRDEAAMAGGNANSPSPATSPMSSQNHHHPFTPETLYEGAGTNGSFLDGIIRKSLDRKASIDLTSNAANNAGAGVGGSSSGALLDQLVKKSPLPFTNNRVANDFAANASAGGNAFGPAFPTAAAGTKRSSSPPAFPGIKRERSSPPPLTMQASSDDEETIRGKNDLPTLLEHNNNNKNNNNNSNGNGRVNHAGSDSEHDIVSMTGCLEPHNTHATNGGNDAAMPKTRSATSPLLSLTETKAGAVVPPPTPPSQPPQPTTSILQEKLAQIKSEQHETEINL